MVRPMQPNSKGVEMLAHFHLDGKQIPFQPGETIMQAAMAAGVYIPHLCHNPKFTPHGSCRLCTVRLNGRPVAACTTPALAESEVENSSEALQQDRRTLLQMLFVEGNHLCPGCEKSGNCQLQAVAYFCGMLAPELTHLYPQHRLDASHPDVVLEPNRCILCALCVRASEESDGKGVFGIRGRGLGQYLAVNSTTGRLADSELHHQDRAVEVCPVGAILPKHKGFEIPIGERLYDQKPISVVGDLADHRQAQGER